MNWLRFRTSETAKQRFSSPAETFIPRRASVPMVRVWHGWHGTIPTCPGMVANFGSANSMMMGQSSTKESLPAGRGNRSSNQSGLLTAFCILFPIEPGGGIFIALMKTVRLKTFARWRQSSACRSGYSVCQPMPLNPPRKLSAHLLNGAFGGSA